MELTGISEISVLLIILHFHSIAGDHNPSQKCKNLMKKAGASKLFGTHTGHSLHAMTLRKLQDIEPRADRNSNVPSVSYDLLTDQKVLAHPNDVFSPDESCFHSPDMKRVAFAFHQYQNENFVQVGLSTQSRLLHEYHSTQMLGNKQSLLCQ